MERAKISGLEVYRQIIELTEFDENSTYQEAENTVLDTVSESEMVRYNIFVARKHGII